MSYHEFPGRHIDMTVPVGALKGVQLVYVGGERGKRLRYAPYSPHHRQAEYMRVNYDRKYLALSFGEENERSRKYKDFAFSLYQIRNGFEIMRVAGNNPVFFTERSLPGLHKQIGGHLP